ncbi:type VII secretion-associated protein [Mycolicibacterium sp. Dal123E01]|uniref:type VII secretion-associated protein n=1 Tax=Mycolicibacterium sp. Dal123E01 TaxID=3457578 RepID=UPI00403E604F
MSSTVLEIGPATVTRLSPHRAVFVDAEMVAAALAGIDDTVVLLGERPVAVSDLWRRVIAATVESRCQSITLVHPSWWSPHRVQRIVDGAAPVAAQVRALARSAVIAGGDPAIVVEIADDVVAISSPGARPVVMTRTHDPCDAVRAIETNSDTRVLLDTPQGVAGATEYARAVLAALRQRGVNAQLAAIRDVSPPRAEVAVASRLSYWRGPAVAAASIVVMVCAIGATVARTHPPAPALDAVNVVEGRVTLQIPPHWTVSRITAGPGSRRIQASSPTEPTVALHITQSYSPGETLERTASVLAQAVAEQPRGVFVDFRAADRRAGRAAITYREVRVARDIRWTVVLDGSTRISVGCQSQPGREGVIEGPCDRAVESAHEVGTDSVS